MSSVMLKLTKAQKRELSEMAGREYRSHYADHYPPIVALLAAGFVDRKEARFGGSTYAITPAGRQALRSRGGEGHE